VIVLRIRFQYLIAAALNYFTLNPQRNHHALEATGCQDAIVVLRN
jgi:hypothetical protein